ncbi:MAG: DUF4340 domain-containing protein [Flavobacteriales bacterium]|nr:DUF4340 domain-containing protein [Flavobacteriales bacterium]
MKRNKYLLFLIILPLFTLVTGCGGKSRQKNELSDFKVEDTASIDKIFMADKSNRKVLLTKENGRWIVDHEFPARVDLINDLLILLKRIEVKQYVPKSALENVIKSLAVYSTKVEIYQKGKLTKTMYVGGPTQDHLGTYMLLEGSSIPFICYVPGFRGYLTPYFMPMPEEWRDRMIFAYHINDIQKIRMEFVNLPDQSYEVTHDKGRFEIKLLKSNTILHNFDTLAVKDWMKNFKNIGFESFLDVNKARLDSVTAKYGIYKISVIQTDGNIRSVALYQIPLPPGTVDMYGNEEKIDVDRMYGIIDGKTLVLCQYFTFDPVTVPASYFFPQSATKKK